MKTDLPALMLAQDLDALLVTGPAQHNPDMTYFTGDCHLGAADLIVPRQGDPLLFYSPMERDEAAKTGLPARDITSYPFKAMLEEAQGDLAKAAALRYRQMLADAGVRSGRIGLYGKSAVGPAYAVYSELQKLAPELSLVGQLKDNLLLQARGTKDAAEVERIRRMGRITTEVVGLTAEFLSSHKARKDVLVNSKGKPVTIGQVKQRINLWLAERGAENPEGTIFAIGRDSGVPHSTGETGDDLRLGQTIVFDIFPCEAGGGYFYDFTRTWCLGYAPDPALELYEDVLSVYRQVMGELKAGSACHPYQQRTCELFEAQGHPTVQSNPDTHEGYVHSLGHGLGLAVHEWPVFGARATEQDRLLPGAVVTIEPGLYYPDRGLGCRLEDTVWVRPDGAMEVLAEYPMDLVLPVRS